jgi:REP element-mobilizing transposase RayT
MHLYIEISATTTIAKLVSAIKTSTARWIYHSIPHRRDFKWQPGYGAFTVSPSDDSSLRHYIRNQERTQGQKPLPDEYRSLLDRHGIAYQLTPASG